MSTTETLSNWFRSRSSLRKTFLIFQAGFILLYFVAWFVYSSQHGARLLPQTAIFIFNACLYAVEAWVLQESHPTLRRLVAATSSFVATLASVLAAIFIVSIFDVEYIPRGVGRINGVYRLVFGEHSLIYRNAIGPAMESADDRRLLALVSRLMNRWHLDTLTVRRDGSLHFDILPHPGHGLDVGIESGVGDVPAAIRRLTPQMLTVIPEAHPDNSYVIKLTDDGKLVAKDATSLLPPEEVVDDWCIVRRESWLSSTFRDKARNCALKFLYVHISNHDAHCQETLGAAFGAIGASTMGAGMDGREDLLPGVALFWQKRPGTSECIHSLHGILSEAGIPVHVYLDSKVPEGQIFVAIVGTKL